MTATSEIQMTGLGGEKLYTTDLGQDLTPQHTVGQAVEHYLDEMEIPENGLRWTVLSRGVRLDMKQRMEQLTGTDTRWTVLPEISAG